MSDTCGPTYGTPLAFFDPDSCSWRTSQGTFPWDSTPSSPTLPPSGSMRSGALYERPTSAPVTDEPDSSSLLRTPTASVIGAKDGIKLSGRSSSDPRVGLADQVKALLPTPVAQDDQKSPAAHVEKKRASGVQELDNITSLTVMAKQAAATGQWSNRLLPTPRTSDANGSGEHGDGGPDLRTAVKMLPTPTASDAKGPSPNHSGTTAEAIAALLPTPRATRGGSSTETAALLGATTPPPSDGTSSCSADEHPTLWTTGDG